jgi:hypothetical protein
MINRPSVFAICLLLAGAPARAEATKLTAGLEKGAVLRYDIVSTVEVASKAGKEKLRQHAVLRLTVAEVDETGETTLRGSFESLDASWTPAEGGEQSFAWKQGQELAEDAPPLAKVYGALGAAPLEVTVTPSGAIKSLDGPDKALEAGEAAKLEHPERALGVLAYHALPQTLAPVFSIDREGKDRKQGDTWTDTTPVPGLGGAAIKVATERTLKELTGSEARVGATITQSWRAPQGKPDPSDPAGAPSDQRGSADERWDTKTGRLASRTQDTSVTWKLSLQTSPPMEASRTVKSHVELKRLGPAPEAPPPAPPPTAPAKP